MTPFPNTALNSIYAAALDPDLWQGALDSVALMHSGVKVHLLHADSDKAHAERSVVSGYAPEALKSYDAHYSTMNAWAPGMLAMRVGVPDQSDSMCAFDILRKTEFYNDWVRPNEDIIGGGGVVLDKGPGQITIFGGNIPRVYRDRLDADWHQSLSILGPAIRHALRVNAALLGLRLELFLAGMAGTGGADAVILLDSQGRLLLADPGGQRALDDGAILRLHHKMRVTFRDQGLNEALAQKLRPALQPTPFRRRNTATDITLCPIEAQTAQSLRLPPGPMNRAPALAIVIRCDAPKSTPNLALRLGLTGAEADLAVQIAEGKTPAEVAEARNTSLHTVRNQLKSALAKTGCRRQTELALLVQQVIRARP